MIMPKRWEVVCGLCMINGYRKGAELGVSTGRFSCFLLAHIDGMHMTAVDLWAPQPGVAGDGAETYETWPHEPNLVALMNHADKHFPGRMVIHRMKTIDAAKHVPDGSLDFVFIDADHTYEGCRADILTWEPKVRVGGMLSGHDYNWPSVKRAVDELGDVPHTASDNVWFRYKR
jgi:hypothetical protein